MEILDEIRARIIGLSEVGNIKVQIAASIEVFVRTIQRLLETFGEDGTYKHKPCDGSHTKKLTDKDVHGIVHYPKTHSHSPISKVTNICPTQVCRRTIQRILHKSGIIRRIAVKTPFLINFC